ncbi:MAG: type II secretion system GspH family protein [Proteobacteria bacterium]|nr:type II secretion system GspH family protein [Pseudomonadota bacterium]MBU1388655.1 type II secretion system GspH family protein [Pseudomonadota bacterium]MBU1544876.1 type II secretion system GspH family protein [Pseudomonadota bacterium]MBU2431699.1 type II secretion system GspH family protein [Pseudomonadota bacterium]MBU2479462.1 type II secretion system GspH family protein [Pseudomonadota bacterium]
MSKSTEISGFTLIELIVVVIIFSILLSLSFPMIRKFSLFSDDGGQAVSIAHLIDELKIKAMNEHTDYILHLEPSSGRLWISHDQMDDELKEIALQKAVLLADGTRIIEIQFADDGRTRSSEYQIRFRERGFSDFAYIRMIEKDNPLTLAIEPFLPQTRILDKHVYFEKCN